MIFRLVQMPIRTDQPALLQADPDQDATFGIGRIILDHGTPADAQDLETSAVIEEGTLAFYWFSALCLCWSWVQLGGDLKSLLGTL